MQQVLLRPRNGSSVHPIKICVRRLIITYPGERPPQEVVAITVSNIKVHSFSLPSAAIARAARKDLFQPLSTAAAAVFEQLFAVRSCSK